MIFGWRSAPSEDGGQRKLVVGLGNPGPKYAGTRHNVGFDVAARLAHDYRGGKGKKKFKGEVVDLRIGEQPVCLLCPETFMNRSGGSVLAAVDFYRLSPGDILVICDDFALALGKLRFRSQGSSGGQKGLADVIRCLGTEEFSRLRIGIGSPPENWDVADYVLSKFGKREQDDIDVAVQRAVAAVGDWVAQGTDYCMNQYNGQ